MQNTATASPAPGRGDRGAPTWQGLAPPESIRKRLPSMPAGRSAWSENHDYPTVLSGAFGTARHRSAARRGDAMPLVPEALLALSGLAAPRRAPKLRDARHWPRHALQIS